jgi:hypothetical protein
MSGFTFTKDLRNYKRSLSEVKEFSSIEEFVRSCNGTRVIKKVRFNNRSILEISILSYY